MNSDFWRTLKDAMDNLFDPVHLNGFLNNVLNILNEFGAFFQKAVHFLLDS